MRKGFRYLLGIGIGCLGLSLIGCSSLKNQIRLNTENHYVKKADWTLRRAVPKDVLQKCGYQFDLETFIFSVDELPGDTRGLYNPDVKAIYYESGDFSALAHERIHALNMNSNGARVHWSCLNEMTAYLVEALIREREGYAIVVRNLKEQNRRQRTR